MIIAKIKPFRVVNPNSFKKRIGFMTTSLGTTIKADSPGSANSEYSVVTALVTYCPPRMNKTKI